MISVINQLSKKLQLTININNFFLRFYIAVWCILPTWWKTFSHQSHFWVHFCRRVWQCRTVCTDDDIIMMGNLFFCILMCIVMHASIFYTTIGNTQQKITCQKEWDVITQSLVYTLMQYIFFTCVHEHTDTHVVSLHLQCMLADACVQNIHAGSSCGRWVRCWSLRRRPPPPAASGSGWLREAADRAASGHTCHLPMLPGWRGLSGVEQGGGRWGRESEREGLRESINACRWHFK